MSNEEKLPDIVVVRDFDGEHILYHIMFILFYFKINEITLFNIIVPFVFQATQERKNNKK